MDNSDNIDIRKARIDIIKKRLCGNCRDHVKSYMFYSSAIPLDAYAMHYIYETDKSELSPAYIPFKLFPLSSWVEIILGTRCSECGHIDFWVCEKMDVEILTSKEMKDAGFSIKTYYAKKNLENILKKTSNELLKSNLEKILEYISE